MERLIKTCLNPTAEYRGLKMKIHDVTLRDGEQQANFAFRREDKLRIAEALVEMGVHRIEAGMPAVSAEDARVVKELAARKCPVEVFALSRMVPDDIRACADCGAQGVILEIPATPYLYEALGWSLDQIIEMSIRGVQVAKECGLYTVLFPIDGSRCDPEIFDKLVSRVAGTGNVDALAAVDTLGVLTPEGAGAWVRNLREKHGLPIEAHFHNDFGLGTANTLAALKNGAETLHVTIGGVGERAGNVSCQEVVAAAELLYDVQSGIDLSKSWQAARTLEDAAQFEFPVNKPIVGKSLFRLETGVAASFAEKVIGTRPTVIFPFHWNVVGAPPPLRCREEERPGLAPPVLPVRRSFVHRRPPGKGFTRHQGVGQPKSTCADPSRGSRDPGRRTVRSLNGTCGDG
ncbi:MAG: pyruvate carboxyltransferase [Proteobacteria bacterium]|nr:pyruvate carboxyltransferase [Pseudomonadota bacterium]